MPTVQLGIITTTQVADTSANPNTVAYRDSSANLNAAIVTGTALVTTGSYTGKPVTQTASFTAGSATHYLCDCTSGNLTATLPLASASAGVVYTFIKIDSTSHTLTVSTVSGSSVVSSQYGKVTVISDGTTWWSDGISGNAITGSTITGTTITATSSLVTGGNFAGTVVAKTANFTADGATDYVCNCTSGNITATLPSASSNVGVTYYFMKTDSSSNTLTVSTVTGNGTTSTQYARLRAVSDGTTWWCA
jgi:hypothetical protein